MFRALLARLTSRFETGHEEQEEDDSDDSDGGFTPSRLDASVLFAHGMNTARGKQEIQEREKQARELEKQRRDE